MTVDPGFESRLAMALQPVRHGFTAAALYTLMRTDLAKSLADGPTSTADLARTHEMNPARVEGLLVFLRNEGYVHREGDVFSLTPKGNEVLEFEPWYTLLVGGYWSTLDHLPRTLGWDASYAPRNSAEVGRGSCGISVYDAIPLVLSLLKQIGDRPRRLIDIGCGDGSFLISLLTQLPDTEGICVDPYAGSVEIAARTADESGMAGRMAFVTATAADFARRTTRFPGRPGDCYLASFALQEALEQDGEEALIDSLRALFKRSPEAYMVVVEVEQRANDPDVMAGDLALAYYNPYFLLHRITEQRLETRQYWDQLFDRAGLRRIATGSVDPRVDSTGFEFGWLLAAT
jgi:2-ketoarginine methyltransferase